MINIEPTVNKSSYCVLSCIIRYLQYLEAPYKAMLLCNWSMGSIRGNKITLPYSISPLQTLKIATGTRINIIHKPDATSEIIQNEINKGKPVIAYVDSYNCDWMTYFHKIHADHYILFIGFEKNTYYALDPYLNNSINRIPSSVVETGLLLDNMGNHMIEKENEKIFIFDKIGYMKHSIDEIVKYIIEKYSCIYSQNIKMLYNYFSEIDTISFLLNMNDIVHNKFYFDLKSIVDSREDFFIGLKYVNSELNSRLIDLDDIREFEPIVQLWKKFLSCLYRFSYTTEIKKRKEIIMRAQEYLGNLQLKEYTFADKILEK